jgi:hypothetical protein
MTRVRGRFLSSFFGYAKNYYFGYNLVVRTARQIYTYVMNKSHCFNNEKDYCEETFGTFFQLQVNKHVYWPSRSARVIKAQGSQVNLVDSSVIV